MKTVYGLLAVLFMCASTLVQAAPLESKIMKSDATMVAAITSVTQKGKKPMHHKKHHKRRRHHGPVHHK